MAKDKKYFVAIVGFPKCGTTSLASAIVSTGDFVYVANLKEPRGLFIETLNSRSASYKDLKIRSIMSYSEYLSDIMSKRAYSVIDASSCNIYYPLQMRKLIQNTSDIFDGFKVIILTRNESERVKSLYRHFLREGLCTNLDQFRRICMRETSLNGDPFYRIEVDQQKVISQFLDVIGKMKNVNISIECIEEYTKNGHLKIFDNNYVINVKKENFSRVNEGNLRQIMLYYFKQINAYIPISRLVPRRTSHMLVKFLRGK